MITIKDIYNVSRVKNTPVFGTSEQLQGLEFLAEYLQAFPQIDRRFMLEKMSYTYIDPAETVEDTLERFQLDVSSYLRANRKRYANLWEAYALEYNPIYNVEEHTTETTTTHQESEGETHSETATEDKFGAQSDTMTDARNTYAFNSTDHVQESDGTASNSSTAHDDTHTGNQDGTSSQSQDGNSTLNRDRVGNIGVTSTIDLLTQHVDFWRAYDFYKIIYEDIMAEYGRLYDPGYDCF